MVEVSSLGHCMLLSISKRSLQWDDGGTLSFYPSPPTTGQDSTGSSRPEGM